MEHFCVYRTQKIKWISPKTFTTEDDEKYKIEHIRTDNQKKIADIKKGGDAYMRRETKSGSNLYRAFISKTQNPRTKDESIPCLVKKLKSE